MNSLYLITLYNLLVAPNVTLASAIPSVNNDKSTEVAYYDSNSFGNDNHSDLLEFGSEKPNMDNLHNVPDLSNLVSTHYSKNRISSFGSSNDIWDFFGLGITSTYDIRRIYGVESSTTESPKIIKDDNASMSNFDISLTLHTPVLSLKYSINKNKLGEGDFNLRYSAFSLNFYNLLIFLNRDDREAISLPSFFYSTGDSPEFSYRALDMRWGPFEFSNAHRVYWDPTNNSYSYTHSSTRYTLVGLAALMESMGDYYYHKNMFDSDSEFFTNTASELIDFPVVPFCTLYLQKDRYTDRRFDKILSDEYTELKFGFDAGVMAIFHICYQSDLAKLSSQVKFKVGYASFDSKLVNESGMFFELGVNAGIFIKK